MAVKPLAARYGTEAALTKVVKAAGSHRPRAKE
jgi:hypothetical protein